MFTRSSTTHPLAAVDTWQLEEMWYASVDDGSPRWDVYDELARREADNHDNVVRVD